MPTEDVYHLYDLGLTADMDPEDYPGYVTFIRVRSRTPEGARSIAARHAGREGRDAWLDPMHTSCDDHGRAHVQWSGVVMLRATGSHKEAALVKRREGLSDTRPETPSRDRRHSDQLAETHRDGQPGHVPTVDPDRSH